MKKIAAACVMAVVLASALATTLVPVWAADAKPSLTVGKVTVTGGDLTVSGWVDCASHAKAQWPEGAPEDTYVLVNVDWTAQQRQPRGTVTAEYADQMAGPCWANFLMEWDPGLCLGPWPDGSYHPCRWDSRPMYEGQPGYGDTGSFRVGLVHLTTRLYGGFWGDWPDGGGTWDLDDDADWVVWATRR